MSVLSTWARQRLLGPLALGLPASPSISLAAAGLGVLLHCWHHATRPGCHDGLTLLCEGSMRANGRLVRRVSTGAPPPPPRLQRCDECPAFICLVLDAHNKTRCMQMRCLVQVPRVVLSVIMCIVRPHVQPHAAHDAKKKKERRLRPQAAGRRAFHRQR